MGNPFGPSHTSRRQQATLQAMRIQHEGDAAATFAALRAQIEAIEATPGAGVAVAAYLPFSSDMLYVQQLGYEGRNVIFLVGERAGTKVRLVFHHTQLQVLLLPVNQDSEKRSKVLYIVPDPEIEESAPPVDPPEDE